MLALDIALLAVIGVSILRFARLLRQYRRADLDVYQRLDATKSFSVDLLTRIRSLRLWSLPAARLVLLAGGVLSLGMLAVSVRGWVTKVQMGGQLTGVDLLLVGVVPLPVLYTVIGLARRGELGEAVRRADGMTVFEATGARRLPPGGNPTATRALGQASIAIGIAVPPPLYIVPSQAVNAFVIGTRECCSIAASEELLAVMDAEQLVAVFAALLVRLDSGLVSTAGPSYDGRLIGRAGLADPAITMDLYASWDDAAVLATRNPGALSSALETTARADDTRLPGLGPQHSVLLWTAPREFDWTDALTFKGVTGLLGESLESRRRQLLRPLVGPDRERPSAL